MHKIEEYEFNGEYYELTPEAIETLNKIFNQCIKYSIHIEKRTENE